MTRFSRISRSLLQLGLGLLMLSLSRVSAGATFPTASLAPASQHAGSVQGWTLVLQAPVRTSALSEKVARVRLLLPGSADPALPPFRPAGLHFLQGIRHYNGPAVAGTFSDSLAGDALNGYELWLRFVPRDVVVDPLTGTLSTRPDTFDLFGLITHAIPGLWQVRVERFDPLGGSIAVPALLAVQVENGFAHHYEILSPAPPPVLLGAQVAGAAFEARINLVDAFGHLVDSAATATLTDSSGSLPATPVSLSGGTVLASGLAFPTALASTFLQVADGVRQGRSNSFEVQRLPVDHLVVEAPGGGVISSQVIRSPFSVRVRAVDANGAQVDTALAAQLSDANAGFSPVDVALLAGSGAASALQYATPLSLTRLAASDGTHQGVSNDFSVAAKVVNALRVEGGGGGPVGPQQVGVPFPVRVQAVDVDGVKVDTSLTATLTDFTGSLGTRTLAIQNGTGTLSSAVLTMITSGTFVRAADGAHVGDSELFPVGAGPLARFVVGGQSGPLGGVVAGEPFDLWIRGVDAFDNLADAQGTVTVTMDSLPFVSRPIAFTKGLGVIQSLVLTHAVSRARFLVSDGPHEGSTPAFAVAPAAVDNYELRDELHPQDPLPAQQAGVPFDLRVVTRDRFGNVADTNYTAPLLGLTDDEVLGSLTFQSGTALLENLVLTRARGLQILRIQDGLHPGSTQPFMVAPGALAHFDLPGPDGQPVPAHTADDDIRIRIDLADQFGNVVDTAFVVQVQDSTGTVEPAQLQVQHAGEVHTLHIRKVHPGNRITVHGAGVQATTNAFAVQPGAPEVLEISAPPSRVLVRQRFPVSLRVLDAYGNLNPSVVGPVMLDDRRHQLAADPAALVAGAWSGSVSVQDTTAGNQLHAEVSLVLAQASPVRARATGGPVLKGTSSRFEVLAPAVRSLAVSLPAGARVAGSTFPVMVQALDSVGAPNPYFSGPVTLTDRTTAADLGAPGPFVAGGTAFNVTLTHSGGTALLARSSGGPTGSSEDFLVQAAPFQKLAFDPIGRQRARVPFPASLRAQDAFGNIIPELAADVNVSDQTGTFQQTVHLAQGSWTGQVLVLQGATSNRLSGLQNGAVVATSGDFAVDAVVPLILGVVPDVIAPKDTVEVLVHGRDFDPGARVSFGPEVTVDSLRVLSSDSLRAWVRASASATPGSRRVSVEQFNAVSYRDSVFQVQLAPLLDLGSEIVLGRTAHLDLDLPGAYFDSATVVNFEGGVQVRRRQFVSAQLLRLELEVSGDAPLGTHNAHIEAGNGLRREYSALRIVDRPELQSVQPESAAAQVELQAVGAGFGARPGAPDSVEISGLRFPAHATDSRHLRFALPDPLPAGPTQFRFRTYEAWSAPVPFRVIAPLRGDVDGNGRIQLGDLALTVEAVMGRGAFNGRRAFSADANADGRFSVSDLAWIVDLALASAPELLASGTDSKAIFHPITRSLSLPEQARAAEWGGACPGQLRGSGWQASAGRIHGLAGFTGAAALILPEEVGVPDFVQWADAEGRVHRASVELPAAPASFASLRNPQRGPLWFAVPRHEGEARLELFEVTGRRVASRTLAASEDGWIRWTPSSRMAQGVYFARFQSEGLSQSARVIWLR